MLRILAFIPLLVSCNHLEFQKYPERLTPPIRKESLREVETTAYTHSEKSHRRWGRKAADGKTLKGSGEISAAADWANYPLGTKFKVMSKGPFYGKIFVIHDYGSALIRKNVIDLYTPSRSQMNKWGRRKIKIEILKWGDYEKSLKILKPRQKYASFVRKMVYGIREKVN